MTPFLDHPMFALDDAPARPCRSDRADDGPRRLAGASSSAAHVPAAGTDGDQAAAAALVHSLDRTRGRGWFHRALIWFFSRPDRRQW